jgi:hypothetical protein
MHPVRYAESVLRIKKQTSNWPLHLYHYTNLETGYCYYLLNLITWTGICQQQVQTEAVIDGKREEEGEIERERESEIPEKPQDPPKPQESPSWVKKKWITMSVPSLSKQPASTVPWRHHEGTMNLNSVPFYTHTRTVCARRNGQRAWGWRHNNSQCTTSQHCGMNAQSGATLTLPGTFTTATRLAICCEAKYTTDVQ